MLLPLFTPPPPHTLPPLLLLAGGSVDSIPEIVPTAAATNTLPPFDAAALLEVFAAKVDGSFEKISAFSEKLSSSGLIEKLASFDPNFDQILPALAELQSEGGAILFAFQEQIGQLGTLLLVFTVVLAVACGLIFGDRSSPTKVAMDLIDGDIFRTELSPLAAAAYDEGISPEALAEIGKRGGGRSARAREAEKAMELARQELFGDSAKNLAQPVSPGTWLELFFCVLIDLFGNASLFIPPWGELTDFLGAGITRSAIIILFDWPWFATLAFWEEALPWTDVVPSATIAWLLILIGGRPWLRARRGKRPKEERVLPPVADLRSFEPAEDYLREGSRPWEE